MDHQKHMNNVSQPGSFLAGMVFGGLAAAGAMLLLAPQSGKRTRAQIQRRGTELKDQATDAVGDAMVRTRGRVRRLRTGTRRNIERLQHQAKLVLEEQTAQVAGVVKAGQHALLRSA